MSEVTCLDCGTKDASGRSETVHLGTRRCCSMVSCLSRQLSAAEARVAALEHMMRTTAELLAEAAS